MIPIIVIVCFIIGALIGWKFCYSIAGGRNFGHDFSDYILYGIGAFVIGLGFTLIGLLIATALIGL